MAEAELVPGRATSEGTRRFAQRFPALPGHWRRPDRLTLSSIGLGTKAGAPGGVDDLLYRSAVPRLLEGGVNVFDTSISYRQQTSERALGRALRRACVEKLATREEVFVISKCGYLSVDAESVIEGRRYLIVTYLDSGLIDVDEVVNGVHVLIRVVRTRSSAAGGTWGDRPVSARGPRAHPRGLRPHAVP
jgi:hypothetical protein